MKLRKVAGWSLLSTIPLGMFTLAVMTNSVPELLFTLSGCAGFMLLLFTAFWLIDGGR